jgi:anhydro-N-acetylmuramic acid kinase
MSVYKTIGIMSGTSLDGVDLAYCVFDKKEGLWEFDIVKAITIPYSDEWKEKLRNSINLSPTELISLDMEYGHYLGKLCQTWILRQQLKPNLVASHGHTVFHNPEKGYTLQIGNGAAMAKYLPCDLVFDFRTQDIALGGQGAPLVPIGDRLLFGEYAACVNLGGIANISFENSQNRVAYDIGFCNIPLNYLANKLGKEYDKNGDIAANGDINLSLLSQLESWEYVNQKYPKSLGREEFEDYFVKIINGSGISIQDQMRTWVEYISTNLAKAIDNIEGKVLITGGGALNSFLIDELKSKVRNEIIIPDISIIDFKEALIFAFLGTLRKEGEINILASVTGASKDHSSGSIINNGNIL